MPGQLRVIRRNGKVTSYDDSKIRVVISKAFLAVRGKDAVASNSVQELIQTLTAQVTETFKRRMPSGGTLHIEEIQDQVELALMRAGEQPIAREFVLFREMRRQIREQEQQTKQPKQDNKIHVVSRDGSKALLDTERLTRIIHEACHELTDVDADIIIKDTLRNLFDGVSIVEVGKAAQLSARAMIEKDPNYSYVAARLLLDDMRGEALRFLDLKDSATYTEMNKVYASYFKHYISRGVDLELLDPKLKDFDLEMLAQALDPPRDLQFTYLGLQTLYDRYFIHSNGTRFELPQAFFMRVASGGR